MTTALITGASVGIGAAFAQQLAARQTDLVLVARSQDKLQELANSLKQQHHIQVDIIVQDLTAPDATETIFQTVQQLGRSIDLLVNIPLLSLSLKRILKARHSRCFLF